MTIHNTRPRHLRPRPRKSKTSPDSKIRAAVIRTDSSDSRHDALAQRYHTVLRTDSASKLRRPEQPEAYNFAKL